MEKWSVKAIMVMLVLFMVFMVWLDAKEDNNTNCRQEYASKHITTVRGPTLSISSHSAVGRMIGCGIYLDEFSARVAISEDMSIKDAAVVFWRAVEGQFGPVCELSKYKKSTETRKGFIIDVDHFGENDPPIVELIVNRGLTIILTGNDDKGTYPYEKGRRMYPNYDDIDDDSCKFWAAVIRRYDFLCENQ